MDNTLTREERLSDQWSESVYDFEYALREEGGDAWRDGLPDQVEHVFADLYVRLEAMHAVARELADLVTERINNGEYT